MDNILKHPDFKDVLIQFLTEEGYGGYRCMKCNHFHEPANESELKTRIQYFIKRKTK